MNRRTLIVFIIFVVVLMGVFFGINLARSYRHSSGVLSASNFKTSSVSNKNTPPSFGDTAENTINDPQELVISTINVDSPIEQVGLDNSGKMDVPKKAEDVAWYQLGYKIGQTGNAVVAGHLDRVDGSPAVFWNLSKLNVGDQIKIKGSNTTLTFKVTKKVVYPENDFPISEVFGPSNKVMLNLITCQGTWDAAKKSYSNRVVVYSELI